MIKFVSISFRERFLPDLMELFRNGEGELALVSISFRERFLPDGYWDYLLTYSESYKFPSLSERGSFLTRISMEDCIFE